MGTSEFEGPCQARRSATQTEGPELFQGVEGRDRLKTVLTAQAARLDTALALAETQQAEAEEARAVALDRVRELEERMSLAAEREQKLRSEVEGRRDERRRLQGKIDELETEVRELREEVDTLQGDIQRAGKIGYEAGYAAAEADIKALIERRERQLRELDVSPRSMSIAGRAAERTAILVDIGHGLHRPAPEMMDTPDGPRPLPDSIDAMAYAFPDTAPDPTGGEVGRPITVDDERQAVRTALLSDLAAKMESERPAGAFSRFWVKNLPEEPDQFTPPPAPAPAELEGWLARLEGRVAALEEAADRDQLRAGLDVARAVIDPEPLRRLAEAAWTKPGNLFFRQSVLDALREAGVIPG